MTIAVFVGVLAAVHRRMGCRDPMLMGVLECPGYATKMTSFARRNLMSERDCRTNHDPVATVIVDAKANGVDEGGSERAFASNLLG